MSLNGFYQILNSITFYSYVNIDKRYTVNNDCHIFMIFSIFHQKASVIELQIGIIVLDDFDGITRSFLEIQIHSKKQQHQNARANRNHYRGSK